jgi:hypothetical protein
MSFDKASRRRTFPQIFAAPLALAAIIIAGLVSALVGDGIWDAVSWIALGTPLATLAALISRGRHDGR